MRSVVIESFEGLATGVDAEILARDLVTTCRDRSASMVIGTVFWEKHTFIEDQHPGLKYLVQELKANGIETLLVLDQNYSRFDLRWLDIVDVVYINYALWRCYDWFVRRPINDRNSQWNPKASRMLFLTGKPNKSNRFRLLWKFYRAGLLDQADWSFFPGGTPRQNLYELVPEETHEKLDEIIKTLTNDPGDTAIEYRGDSLHSLGVPLDAGLFAHARFRVISETDTEYNTRFPYPWISEKTWITVFNNLPWIMAGEPNTCRYLRQRNFDTFEWAAGIDYDQESNTERRMDLVVDTARVWLNSDLSKEAIAQAVSNNFHSACVMGSEIERTIESMIYRHDLDCTVDAAAPTRNKLLRR